MIWRARECAHVEIAGELLALVDDQLIRLDVPATAIWKLLDPPVDDADMTWVIAKSTGRPKADVERDVRRALNQLAAAGLASVVA